MTSSLPRKCSTTELQQPSLAISCRFVKPPTQLATNRQGPPSKRVKGIEPSSSAWKAVALPLSYTRRQWGEQDSNLRSPKTTDLQSVPVGHFGIPPIRSFPVGTSLIRSPPYQISPYPISRFPPIKLGPSGFLETPKDNERSTFLQGLSQRFSANLTKSANPSTSLLSFKI